ncbi:MAG: hypothetical protein K2K75_12790 [Muribaculaceae bacterium]|nr:hypothetical protein [Muribaculaceae bacterium]
MSVLDQLDVNKYFNGEMDRWIEKRHEMLEMMIAARCKEKPNYLKDKSLLTHIIEV